MAYFLGLPENAQRFAWDPARNWQKAYGLRMKEYMTALSYQRCPNNAKVNPALVPFLTYDIPATVNAAYNGAYGPMNSKLDSAPEPPSRDNASPSC